MLTYTQSQAQDILMKPVRIKAVVDGLVALQTANVVSQNTVDSVVNTIFTEIVSDSSAFLAEWNTLIDDLKDHSEYLYRTTDEINESIGSANDNVSQIETFRLKINDVYENIKDGYSNATTMTSDYTALDTDFYDPSALFRSDYANSYASMTYTTESIANVVSQIYSSSTLLDDQINLLASLKSEYPTMSIESGTATTATYLPNVFWVKLIGSDQFYIYENAAATLDIGNRFPAGSLLANRVNTYTVNVLDTDLTGDNPDRRFMVMDGADETSANVHFIAQGASLNLTGDQFKSMAFEGIAPANNAPAYSTTNSGLNAVIQY